MATNKESDQPDEMRTGEWAIVVTLLAVGILATAMFVGYMANKKGLLTITEDIGSEATDQ